jgi:plasmid stabilization system protein ParE
MRVQYTPLARADREAIFQYLNERSPVGARRVMAAIVAATEQLIHHPLSGSETEFPGIRATFAGRYPYKIYYRLRNNAIELIHIRHTSRRPWEGGS